MKERIIHTLHRRFTLPYAETIQRAFSGLSFAERLAVQIFAGALIISAFVLLYQVNQFFVTEIPVRGGSLTEGVIGSPRFINPLLAISDADRDLTALIYSGLLKVGPEGKLIPDLANSVSISSDGRTYDFTLKNNIYFHDGTPVTADDVEFTVLKAQDGNIKSPKRANWDSVSVEVVSPTEIRFTLKQPYAPFLENATIGILPKHIWKNASAEEFALSLFNIEPIGSGPYQVSSIKRNSLGIPDRYDLKPFDKYVLGAPYIEDMHLAFYPNETALIDAYKGGSVDAINSISPETVQAVVNEETNLIHTPLPRIFALFFNQNQAPVFANKEVRVALDHVISKDKIVSEILGGYGVPADGPMPYGTLKETASNVGTTSEDALIDEGKKILTTAGWKFNDKTGVFEKTTKKDKQTLSFSISTSNAPELKKAAGILKERWEKLGAKVEVKIFEAGDLNQNVIRPRKYDTLLFGEIIGRDLDLFAFWHSSQRNDPGLNVALYTNTKTDKILTDARNLSDPRERLTKYTQFEQAIKKDVPAVFLYSPEFIYLLPKSVEGVSITDVTIPSDRFNNVSEWHIETEKVWNVFTKN